MTSGFAHDFGLGEKWGGENDRGVGGLGAVGLGETNPHLRLGAGLEHGGAGGFDGTGIVVGTAAAAAQNDVTVFVALGLKNRNLAF